MIEERPLARLIRLRRHEELDAAVDGIIREHGWSEVVSELRIVPTPTTQDVSKLDRLTKLRSPGYQRPSFIPPEPTPPYYVTESVLALRQWLFSSKDIGWGVRQGTLRDGIVHILGLQIVQGINLRFGSKREHGYEFFNFHSSLEPFEGIQASSLDELRQKGRKFIDYAGFEGSASSMANPISLQADARGGGVVSYGLSSQITYDHIISNSSLSGLFMQVIASHNLMNLWGASPKKQSISDVRVGVERFDKIQVLAQEGWTQEWVDDSGTLDVFTEEASDYDGADWASFNEDVTYGEEVEYSFNDTIKIRQPGQEMSKWDGEAGQLAFKLHYDYVNPHTGETPKSSFDYPTIRYPIVQMNRVEFDLNTTDLQSELQSGPLYLVAELRLDDWIITREMTITEDTNTITFDLDQLAPEVPDPVK
ncbi:MAG: hypothetical protein ACE5H4_08535 [Candidatus Thorarchaeota archaeon]